MDDASALESRVAQLETCLAETPSRWSPRRIIWLVGLFALGVLTLNVWLLFLQYGHQAKSQRNQDFWAVCHSGLTSAARTECFLRLVAEGNTEWRSARLTTLNLDGADLTGARLEHANFDNCSLADAVFTRANLKHALFPLSDLTRSDLSNAISHNASFFKTDLTEANFRNADLLSASLEQVRGHRSSFVLAKMGDAFLVMADLTEANLTGADLSGANLEAAVLRGAELALANFADTRILDADFTDTNWWRARGFSSQQLETLLAQFPPTPTSPESRHRDFETWMAQRNARSNDETPPTTDP